MNPKYREIGYTAEDEIIDAEELDSDEEEIVEVLANGFTNKEGDYFNYDPADEDFIDDTECEEMDSDTDEEEYDGYRNPVWDALQKDKAKENARITIQQLDREKYDVSAITFGGGLRRSTRLANRNK